tara:strand:- start:457 stop:783 length:327 start_codon:yes stop_codon:yes gene_type:complete
MNGSKNEASNHFSIERAQELADLVISQLNKEQGSVKEKVYAISHVLHALGETIYDRDDLDRPSVEDDYNRSPTWAAGLILASYIPHDLLEKLTNVREEHQESNIEPSK